MVAQEPIYTMGAMLRATAGRVPDADALIFPDRKLSYAALQASARAWAKSFIAMGVQPGQNIGILLTTRPDFVEIFYGIVMIGAVAVPVNARYQASELSFLLKDADLVALVTTGKVADNLAATTTSIPMPTDSQTSVTCARTRQMPRPTPTPMDSAMPATTA